MKRYRKSKRSKRKYSHTRSRAKKYNRGRTSRRRKNPKSDCMGALRVLVDHAQEMYPHFESPRGQADIKRALTVLKRSRSRSRNPKKRWTLSDIKAANAAAGYLFFNRKTLQGWGETMRNYKVEHDGDRILIHRTGGKAGSRSFVFDPKTKRIRSIN